MARAIAAVLVVSALGLAVLAFAGFRAWDTADSFRDRTLRLDAIRRVIGSDEILTMSARLAAADGDPRWERRYREHAPALASTLAELRSMASTEPARAALVRLETANDELVRAENDALRLAHDGRLPEARDILDGSRYASLKAAYAVGLRDLLQILEAESSARDRAAARTLTISTVAGIVVLGAAFAAWVALLVSLRRERAQLAALLQAQKMESVGRLAAGVAHDFNNMLTAINGYAGFALKEATEPARRDLENLRRVVGNAADLVRRLLDFARRRERKPERVDLNAAIRGVEPLLLRLAKDAVELRLALAETPAFVVADPVELQQLVLNLVVNARDAMPEGGTITVETRPDAVLLVADTGPGMTPEVKAHLFEPWFTTKEEGRGTGLGLSIVTEIVKRTGATIGVESEPGKGTIFRVAFTPSREA